MIIRLEGQLYKTDPWVADLFTDILNALGGAATPAELHQALLRLCRPGHGPDPRRYFRWGFNRDSFWLQQRMDQRLDPDTERLYPHKLLTVMAYNDTNSLPQTN